MSGRLGSILFALILPCVVSAVGCSLQDFDYLKDNHGGNTSGAGGASALGIGGGGSEAAAGSSDVDAGPGVHDGGSTPSDAGDAADGTTAPLPDAPGVSVIVNGSFEQGYTGWSFDPITAEGKYAYTQYPVVGAYTIDGQYELATWHGSDAFRVRIFQSLVGLENGRYTFKGWFTRGDGHNAVFVYSSGCGGPDQQFDIPLTNATQWTEVGIGGIDVTNNQCEVGFVVDANPTNWLNADAFTFERDPQ